MAFNTQGLEFYQTENEKCGCETAWNLCKPVAISNPSHTYSCKHNKLPTCFQTFYNSRYTLKCVPSHIMQTPHQLVLYCNYLTTDLSWLFTLRIIKNNYSFAKTTGTKLFLFWIKESKSYCTYNIGMTRVFYIVLKWKCSFMAEDGMVIHFCQRGTGLGNTASMGNHNDRLCDLYNSFNT